MSGSEIVFEQIRSSGCLSYVLGCAKEKICVVIDPEIDKATDYIGLAEFFKSKLLYAIDTHTHAFAADRRHVRNNRLQQRVVALAAAE